MPIKRNYGLRNSWEFSFQFILLENKENTQTWSGQIFNEEISGKDQPLLCALFF